MKTWSVSGHYPYAVEADDENAAVEVACDKIGNGWEWEAVEAGAHPNALPVLLAELEASREKLARVEALAVKMLRDADFCDQIGDHDEAGAVRQYGHQLRATLSTDDRVQGLS